MLASVAACASNLKAQAYPSHSTIEGKASNGEDFANFDDDEAEQEQLHLSANR
jgi:hypothetical protein